jgi:chromosome segregation ATPase
MLTLDRPQDANSKERGAARNVQVRVRPNGPLVDLPLGKTTIGASPRCTIRIQQPGVQPLHCLLLNDVGGLSVRRWAGETVLNGRLIEESAIDAGDYLRVGPVELEIMAPEASPPGTTESVSAAVSSSLAAPPPPPRLASGTPAAICPAASVSMPSKAPDPAPTDSSQYRIGREVARSRGRRLLAALRERRESDRALQRRVADLEGDLERAACDRRDFAGQLQTLTSELAEARRQVTAQQASAGDYQEIASQNEHLGREVCSMIERIEQLTNELTATSAALHGAVAEKESLAEECHRLSGEQRQLREQLQQHSNHCEELATERNNSREQCESLRSELRSVTEREAAAIGKAEHLERELSALQQYSAELANQNSSLCCERDEAWRQCESLRSNVNSLSEREASLAQNVAWLEHEKSQQQLHRDELLNQIAALSGERDQAWRQCEALRSDAQSLKDRESALSDSIRRLEHANGLYESREAELSNQVAAVCGERDEAWRQCESLRSNVQSLTDRECALSERIRLLEHADSQHQSREAELSNQIVAACSERDEAWRQCESLRSDVQSLTEREVSQSERIGRLEHANGQHQSRETELSNQIAELIGERDAAWRQCESLRAEINSTKDRDAALSENVRRLEQESCENQRRADELSQQLAGTRNERDEAWRQCETLRSEIELLNKREAALAENIDRLEQQGAERVRENTDLVGQIGAIRAEHDDLRDQNEQLRSQVKNFAHERAVLTEEHAAGSRELDSLRAQLQAAGDKEIQHTEELAKLVAECQRYRQESDRLPQLEQQIRDAVADRENTSSELYRALLQLAEMQERDDHNVALEAAYRAVNAELEKSTRDIAELQAQIDHLSEDRIATDEARQSLDRRTAELIEAHQQLAYDKSTLNAELIELREQLDASRQREAELAADLESAEALRQRLAESEQILSEQTEAVIRIQDELKEKNCVEADAAAAIAERDRQIAEYAQLLAESGEAVRLLELQSTASAEALTQFEQARDDWQREREEAAENQSQLLQRVNALESKLADAQATASLVAESSTSTKAHAEFEQARDQWRQEREEAAWQHSQLSQRLAELEAQLAVARAAASGTAQSAAYDSPKPFSAGWNSEFEDCSDSTTAGNGDGKAETDFGNVLGTASAEPTAECNWSSRGVDVTPESESDENPFFETAHQPPATGSMWGTNPEETALPIERDDELDSSRDEAWRSSSTRSADADWTCTKSGSWTSPGSTAEVSEQTPLTDEELHATPEVETATLTRKAEPTSFIERYSHMFANESVVEAQTAPAAPVAPAMENRMRSSSGAMRPAGSGPSLGSDGDEESIEEYMAKLLQRVRGDAPGQTVAAITPSKQGSERVLSMTAPANFPSAPLTAPPSAGGADVTSSMGFEPAKRRSSLPGPQTDLEALRALANESARRAISRHALRKHRRTALTKVIVSSLAGVTSLWLMLESESWFNLQFITACVSMCVAAYWASETFRTLLESYRVATSDETDEEIEELSAKLRSPLPIDVESTRSWTTQPLNLPDEKLDAERVLAEQSQSG